MRCMEFVLERLIRKCLAAYFVKKRCSYINNDNSVNFFNFPTI